MSRYETLAGGNDYKVIAASQTDAPICGSGKTAGTLGDYIAFLLIVPEVVGAGTVSLKDGGGSAMNVFVTGTLPSLVPFPVPVQTRSAVGGWTITTGAGVHVFVIGNF